MVSILMYILARQPVELQTHCDVTIFTRNVTAAVASHLETGRRPKAAVSRPPSVPSRKDVQSADLQLFSDARRRRRSMCRKWRVRGGGPTEKSKTQFDCFFLRTRVEMYRLFLLPFFSCSSVSHFSSSETEPSSVFCRF